MSNMTDDSQPLITHLVELRNRLLRCVICILVVFVALVYFSNDIYHFVAAPLTAVMPKGATMIATNIQTPFFTPIKLTAIVSVFISVPYLLYQIWAFVAPALYQHEKRLIYPLLFSSTVLFYCGVAFAYYVVFPFVFSFFTQTAPEGVAIATDISSCHYFALLDRCHNHESIGGKTPLYYCGSVLCWHDLNATRRVLSNFTCCTNVSSL